MQKPRVLSSNKKLEQLPAETDSGSATKLRTSAYGRFIKTFKSLAKISSCPFQIRRPLNVLMIEELNNLGRKTYFQRVHILAQNIEQEKLKENSRNSDSNLSDLQQPDFREYFQHHVEQIFATCEKKKCTRDNFAGLFIDMGCSHTYLMIEGAEDMLANFFEELVFVHDALWTSSRVFLVEDKIGETFFRCFYSRRSAAININETFPSSTANDYEQMATLHLKLKEKILTLAGTLALQLKNAKTLNKNESSSDVTSQQPFDLPADPFNKLLPEIQHIDLILKANRFYRTVKDFARTYKVIQIHQDEDAFVWPIPNNYLPLDIFKRSAFDVNLTFGNYGQEDSTQDQDRDNSCCNDVQEVPRNSAVK